MLSVPTIMRFAFLIGLVGMCVTKAADGDYDGALIWFVLSFFAVRHDMTDDVWRDDR